MRLGGMTQISRAFPSGTVIKAENLLKTHRDLEMEVRDLFAGIPVGAGLDSLDSNVEVSRARARDDFTPALALLAVIQDICGGAKQRVGRVRGVLTAAVGLAAVRPVGLARAAR